MNVLTDRVRLAALDKADRLIDLVKILARIYADECARRTILFARICCLFRTWRIEPGVFTEVAFDREQVFGLRDGLGDLVLPQRKRRKQRRKTAFFRTVLCTVAGDHRDSVIRALRRAVAAADTGDGVDVDLAVRKPRDRTGRAPGQAFGVLTVHTNRRHQDTLDRGFISFEWPLDVDAAPNEPRMAVDLMTRERTIAAADALGHVHHEQIDAVDDAGLDLLGRCRNDARV